MSQEWQFQLRLSMDDATSKAARNNPADPAVKPLMDVLAAHKTDLKSQYEAFAGYCREAEENGVENYHLYEWTKATIENPEKKAKYLKSFTLYIGGDEVYDKDKADALEADLLPLIDGEKIISMAKYDTNPANNPQPPKR